MCKCNCSNNSNRFKLFSGRRKDITVNPELKPHLTAEQEVLLVDMWHAIAKRNYYSKCYERDNRNGIYTNSEYESYFEDAKNELSKQRKITLGKIYYSNNKLWKYLTGRCKDISILG